MLEKIFIGVGDIHPDGQKFQKWCQFDEFDQDETSQDSWEDNS